MKLQVHLLTFATLYFCILLIGHTAVSQPLTKTAIQVGSGNTVTTGMGFGYRLTYNCSSGSGPCLNAEVVDLLPSGIQYVSTVPASPTGDVAAINVTQNFMGSGRTRVQFVMISPLPAGNSGDLLINVRFPNGSTPDGATATNTADGINLGATPGSLTTPPVTVNAGASSQVTLTKTLQTSPANLDMPESYRLRLSVPSSNGALNLTAIGPVTDTLPAGAVFNGATPAADCEPGCVGTTPAIITWTAPCSIPLVPGGNCDLNVNVTFPSATFSSGSNVTNSFAATGTPLGKPSQNLGVGQVTHPVTTFVPNPAVAFSKNIAAGSPNPPTLNQTFSYDLNISNNGNVPLDNMVVIDTLPVQMQVASVTSGAYSGLNDFSVGVGVRVSYEKNTAPGVFTLWGSSPNTTTNTTLTAPPPGLGAGEFITRIRWEYGQAQVGMSVTTRPLITGKIVNPDNNGGAVAFGDTIQNCAALSAVYTSGPTNVNRNSCASFILSGPFVQLNPAKENLSGGGPFNPGQSVNWRLRVRSSPQSSDPVPLENVVVLDLLPIDLIFSNWTFDDQGTGLPAPQNFAQIPNYAGTGRTLLRWSWNAGSGNLGVNQQVWINLATTVRSGAKAGSLNNDILLGSDTPGLAQRCSGSSQTDSLDLDGDGNTAETFCRATGSINVASIAQFISSKTLKGSCDQNFVSTSAGTLKGGPVSYSIRVQNVGTVSLQNLILIDILPFVGDTNVRDSNPRGSQFTPLLVEPITPPSGTIVYYSTSGNPCRGEVGGPTTSCDPPNWTTVPPSPITSVRSIKVEFGSRTVVPFDFFEFKINLIAPADLSAGSSAYNSFAFQADRSDGLGAVAAEPQKVGITLGSCDAATLGDYVFADTNGNGIQDDGPSGINGVTLRLVSPGPDGLQGTLDDIPLATTVTANGPNGAPGWYNFPGLAPGSYFVCATLPANYFFSPLHATGNSLDSDANPATGCTSIVTLGVNQTNNDLDVGLIPAQSASIGNYVWFDRNGDGIQNESPSEGANGVTVRLYARNGGTDTLVASTITADDEAHRPGYYSFGSLTPGQQYFVEFVLPASATAFTTVDVGGDDTIDSDAAVGTGRTPFVTLAAGEFNRTLDAGLVKSTGSLSLGDQVWSDPNNNGIFEPQNGEVGIDGVLLWLYLDVNGNGLPDADEYIGQTVTSTKSGFSGRYLFSGLAAGNYIVVIPSSNFAGGGPLAGRTSSTGNSPAPDPDDDVDGDDNGRTLGTVLGSLPVTLTANGEPTSEDGDNNTNLTVDFGFTNAAVAPLPPTISKAFGAQFVGVSGATSLTFTITNPNATPLTNIGFNDPLPAGLVVATPNGLTGSCVAMPINPSVTSAGAVTAVAGSTNISVSSLALTPGGSCTVTVNTLVTTSSAKYNKTGNIIAGEGVIGETASAALSVCTVPGVTTNPTDQSILQGGTATFTAAASGSPTPTVQWQVSTDGGTTFTDMVGANTTTLTVSKVTAAMNGYRYRAVFMNSCGSATTTAATLTVNPFDSKFTDPLVCLAPGNLVTVTASITNMGAIAVPVIYTATNFAPNLIGIPGSGLATVDPANFIITAAGATYNGTLQPGQTVNLTFKALIAPGVAQGAQICITSTATINGGAPTALMPCTIVGCPAALIRPQVSDQKPGSVLVFPYYTSNTQTRADTRITISNIGAGPALTYVHLFFIDGTTCQQADQFLCLTPNASYSLKTSDYDPGATGWLLAVAVDAQGRPLQNNVLIGNAFVVDGDYIDNYGAESFAANSALVAAVNGATATLLFDGVSYDAVPNQLVAEVQSAQDAPGQRLVTVGLSGDLNAGVLTGAAQVGTGLAVNGNERPFGSFNNFLVGNCQAVGTITATTPRVPLGINGMIPAGQVGTLRFNVGAAVGLILTPRPTTYRGIRTLHKTSLTTTTITIPIFIPVC